MKRFFSPLSLEVSKLRLDVWNYPKHNHSHFELIVINEGTGNHVLNDVSFKYSKGHVFLLAPQDFHYFEIETHTVFTYIKFTEQIFFEKTNEVGYILWLDKITNVLENPNTVPECIIKNKDDKRILHHLIEILFEEYNQDNESSRELILELFGAIILIVIRNLNEKNIKHKDRIIQVEKQKINKILTYIRQNINKRESITQKNIAEIFFISSNYLSSYLKKHTGMSLQKMISETRLKTAENMLKQSGFTISQIAYKLGFNDSSHMNKTFKKYRGKNPTEFRK